MVELNLHSFLLPGSPIERVARFVREQGIEAYLVGGCVRDALLGRSSRDFDFVVLGRALPLARRVANRFGVAFYALDAERDTGRVIFGGEAEEPFYVDFASARGGSLLSDLALRDFTVNAIAVRLDDGQLVDPCGGRADLDACVLRAVSDRVFHDDPLRMLRGVRLAAELGFEMEPRTEKLLRQAVPLLAEVSAERARDEFCKVLSLPGAAESLERLSELGLLSVLLPEVEALRQVTQSAPHYFSDAFTHTLEAVRWAEVIIATLQRGQETCLATLGLSSLRRFPLETHLAQCVSAEHSRATLLKLSALLHDVGKPATRTVEPDGRVRFLSHEKHGARLAGQVLTRMRFSVREVRLVQTAVANHMRSMFMSARRFPSRREIYRFFRDTGEFGVDTALLALADHRAVWGAGLQPERWAHLTEVVTLLLTHWYERREQTVDPPRLISGRDLMAYFGLKEGPRIGELLEAVREAQVAGQVRTREEALDWVAQILDR